MMRWLDWGCVPALLIVIALAAASAAAQDVPHVESCNYCMECKPDKPSALRHLQQLRGVQGSSTDANWLPRASSAADDAKLSALGLDMGVIKDVLLTPHNVTKSMIGPADHGDKLLKPNCTVCYGCTVDLADIGAEERTFGNVKFTHGLGATNAWLFFAKPHGTSTGKRYIVKVYCMPYAKTHGRPKECPRRVYVERLRLMMAQVALTKDCGASELTPRMWIAPVHGVVPNGTHKGYHVRWWGLWMEEAPGITLHGLMESQNYPLMYDLFTKKLNKTQVVIQTVLDLLSAQCDRHGENVFITANGQLTYIDNDRSLGVVGHCAGDSLLLPGTRYHTWVHTGQYLGFQRYYEVHGKAHGFCNGPVDPRVVIDYRCYVPNGKMGRLFPQNVHTCLTMLAGSDVDTIVARYGFSSSKPALILRTRAIDLLKRGFEETLRYGRPRTHPKYLFKEQPACCGMDLSKKGHQLTCSHCWQPILGDLMQVPPETKYEAGEYADS